MFTMKSLLNEGANQYFPYYFGAVVSAGIFYLTLRKKGGVAREKRLREQRQKRLVVISGCDSGLGLTMAYWAAKSGYKVLAGCFDEKGSGAEYLQKEFKEDGNIYVFGLDVTKKDSIAAFQEKCQDILRKVKENNKPIELWAVVANAAVAVFGEFLWQTEDQQERQMKVNFWGTVNLTTAFKSLLFQYKSRVIVISSDCASYPLPFLGIYCATKAALESWARTLRLEVAKYGVSVVAYQPGAFSTTSRLFASQSSNYLEMKEEMSENDKLFYGDYFDGVFSARNDFFEISRNVEAKPMENYAGEKHFFNVLEGNIKSQAVYIYEDIGHKIFHSLIKYLPQKLSDTLVNKLLMNKIKNWVPTTYPDNM